MHQDRGFIAHYFTRSAGFGLELLFAGRLESGESFAGTLPIPGPLAYVRDGEARARGIGHRATGLSTMDGEALVLPVGSTAGLRTYEADLSPADRYLMDKDIRGSVAIEGEWTPGRRVGRYYRDPKLTPAPWNGSLAVLSIDIETVDEKRRVVAVALAGRGPGCDTAEVHVNDDERTLLRLTIDRIRELDPDIITGWNVGDFDLSVLERRSRETGLGFAIGRTGTPAHAGAEGSRRTGRWVVEGRQVLDALRLTRGAGLGLEDYRLETAARQVLGRGKDLDTEPGENRARAVERLFRTDRDALARYCLEDARLALDILAEKKLIELTLAKALNIGVGLDRTWQSIRSFEHLYLQGLHKRRIAAPTKGVDAEAVGGAPGGGILEPRPGLYRNVLVFDFKSLYPSLMRTFNIDPLARVRARRLPDTDCITAPNGARFSREAGVLPSLLDRFHSLRNEAKRVGDEVASHAYKIIQNSFYGVLGTPGCRFAAAELAGAITTFGRHLLGWSRDWFEARGFAVIYGDTDSLFVVARDESGGKEGPTLAADLNRAVGSYVRSTYRCESRLELEFEKQYIRFLLPRTRNGDEERGRAKGYAGLTAAGKVEVVGMEAVRSDWTPLARRLQEELLGLLFADRPPADLAALVDLVVGRLLAGEIDDELVYRRSIRKPTEAYTKNTPPHVRAARMLDAEDRHGSIRYLWTRDGPEPESRRTSPIDYRHYLEKQVRPIVEGLQFVCDFRPAGLPARAADTQLELF